MNSLHGSEIVREWDDEIDKDNVIVPIEKLQICFHKMDEKAYYEIVEDGHW